jgi:hypothetical protein
MSEHRLVKAAKEAAGMAKNPPDDLVERARTAAEKVYGTQFFNEEIEAAIAIALEEAAKVADANALEAWCFGADETRGLMRLQAADIAAAIRGMITPGSGS